MPDDERTIESIRRAARPLRGDDDLDPLMEMIGDARFVLLGEATHGTHEFYDIRARLTRRLITEKGFAAVAVEADWPDAYRVNRFIRGLGGGDGPIDALGDFQRFPMWMWRNTDVLELIGWLREHNTPLDPTEKVGFYGLDLYSLHHSMAAVVEYLEKIDPDAAHRARERYACFDHFDHDPARYGFAANLGVGEDCEEEVVRQLAELRTSAMEYLSRDGLVAEDELFSAEQNARLARNAESYYRKMYTGNVSTWNLRDEHMAETLDALASHLGRHGRREGGGGEPGIVVWEHNSHLGDARATSMGERGEWNVGQLVRQRHDGRAVSIGFSTYDGSVTAAHDWDGPARRRAIRPGREDSYEGLFHRAGEPAFWLNLRDDPDTAAALRGPRLERAIGVIYRPETERASHYFHARLPEQFDAVIHIDRTHALEPLDRVSEWEIEETPETYPSGL